MDFRNKLQYSLNNKALILIVLGILILVNVLSTRIFVRFDWTRNNQYSISDATVSILADLEDLFTVDVYFSSDLPPQLVPAEQYVKDILGEYKAYGSGNFDYEFVDLEGAEAQQEAQRVGVQRVEMQVLENDRYQVRNGYFGLSLSYAGKTESIPVIQQQDLGNLEYDLTSLIVKMTQPRLQVVGLLQGHGEHGILRVPGPEAQENDYTVLAEAIRKHYELRMIDFAKGQTLDEVDVLLVAGSKRDLTERAVFEIDQYLLAGGKAIFLIDAVDLLPGSVSVVPQESNLSTLMSPLGVTVQSSLILDTLAEFANFQVGPGRTFIVPYPLFIRLVADNFSSNPIVSKLAAVVVRFASPLSIQEQEGLEYDRFMNTSVNGWVQEGPQFSTDPNGVPNPTEEDRGSQPFAVSVTGMLPRLSEAPSVPILQEWIENDDGSYELSTVTPDENRSGREVLTEATAESTVIVFGDSDFVADQYIAGANQTPVVLLLNTIDFMTFGDALISIRSKALNDAPIADLDAGQKSLMKFLGILLVPLLISAYGVFRLWMRRKEEKLLKL